MSLKAIALGELKPNEDNRRFDPKNLKTLTRSIESHGIIQPLAVRKNGNGYVILAGHRRFAALNLLMRAKKSIDGEKVTKAFPVPCQVMAPEVADAEIILAENTQRVDMHWADLAKLCAKSVAEGETSADLAARFDYSTRTIEQYIAIAGILPEFLELGLAGKLEHDTACVLTTCPPDMQKRLLPMAKKGQLREWTVREMLRKELFPVDKAMPGVEAEYVKRGGVFAKDLFGSDGKEAPRYFENRELAIAVQVEIGQKRLEKAGKDYAHAAAVSAENLRNMRGLERYSAIKAKERLSYFLVTHEDGSVSEEIGYLAAHDPQAKKVKEKAAKAKTAGKAEDNDAATLTLGTSQMLNQHRTAVVRRALMGAPFRFALELALVAILTGNGTVRIKRERTHHGESGALYTAEKTIDPRNKADFEASLNIGKGLFVEAEEDGEIEVYAKVQKMTDGELQDTFMAAVAKTIDNAHSANFPNGLELLDHLARKLELTNSGYRVDRLYLEGVRTKDRLAAIAKTAGVEPGGTKAETIERILKSDRVKTGLLTDDAAFVVPPKAERPKKKAA